MIRTAAATLLLGAILLGLIAMACFAAYLAGQGTRVSEADATSRAKADVAMTVARMTGAREAAVAAVRRAARRHERDRVRSVHRMWRRRWTARARRHRQELEVARRAGVVAGLRSARRAAEAAEARAAEERTTEAGVQAGAGDGER